AIDLSTDCEPWRLECAPMVRGIVDDIRNGRSAPEISSAFHNTLAKAIAIVVGRIRKKTSIRRVALTGGVFQNTLLLARTFDALVAPDGLEIRDWLLIHVGFAVSKIDEVEAARTLELLTLLGDAYEQELSQMRESRIE